MPYITLQERMELDPEIDALVKKLREAPLNKLDGFSFSPLLTSFYLFCLLMAI